MARLLNNFFVSDFIPLSIKTSQKGNWATLSDICHKFLITSIGCIVFFFQFTYKIAYEFIRQQSCSVGLQYQVPVVKLQKQKSDCDSTSLTQNPVHGTRYSTLSQLSWATSILLREVLVNCCCRWTNMNFFQNDPMPLPSCVVNFLQYEYLDIIHFSIKNIDWPSWKFPANKTGRYKNRYSSKEVGMNYAFT